MATPLSVPVELVGLEGADGGGPLVVTATTVVDPDNPLFAGHYPGFPIFPGVCLMECVHHGVLLAAAERKEEMALASVRATRFLNPAFPGDRLDLTIKITAKAGGWDCDGRITRAGQDIAKVRLRFAPSGDAR